MTDKPHSRIPSPGATYRMRGSRKLYKFRTKEPTTGSNPQAVAKPDEYRLDLHTKSGRLIVGLLHEPEVYDASNSKHTDAVKDVEKF